MKIVSKYKDFYDYLVQDNDADLTYVRNINIVNEYYDDLFKNKENYTPYYSVHYGYTKYRENRYRELGELFFSNYIFGIYPYIYSQPTLCIAYNNLAWGGVEVIQIILSKTIVNDILNNGNFDNLIKLAQAEFNKLVDKRICNSAKVHFANINTNKDLVKTLKSYVWKIECKEIFYKIESPVFVKYYPELFENSAYWEFIYNWKSKEIKHYITNICFNKLDENILKYWYDELNEINTYNNIENFLWSIKQEPIANPDNKTKIVAHGFDLKTSFRKM